MLSSSRVHLVVQFLNISHRLHVYQLLGQAKVTRSLQPGLGRTKADRILDHPSVMPTLEANDITINYLLEIPPPPPPPEASNPQQHSHDWQHSDLVVLINGLADDLTTWSAQVPSLLEAGYSVLRYDNRGIGRSSRPPGPYTAELMADDLHALLCALETQGLAGEEVFPSPRRKHGRHDRPILRPALP